MKNSSSPVFCLLSSALRIFPVAIARKSDKPATAPTLPVPEQSQHSSLTPHCNFSHPRTYATAIRKNSTVAAIKIRSNIDVSRQLKL
jgi:hypothetical protein